MNQQRLLMLTNHAFLPSATSPRRRARVVALTCAIASTMASASCGNNDDMPACGTGPYFTVLPVAEGDIKSAGPLGGLNPPGHTVPNDHAGLYVNTMGVTIVVPGDMRVKRVRRSRYLVSPVRQGQADFAIYFDLCRDIEGQLGHLTTLRADLEARIATSDCTTYSTSDETLESCVSNVNINLLAGEPLGTVGGATAMAFDFGTYDARHTNEYVNPSRVLSSTLHSVCPYELFAPTEAEYLLSRVGFSAPYRTVEPRCGSMNVDVAGTPQGVWVRADQARKQGGDESMFLTLAFDQVHPETAQVLALGPPELGAAPFSVPILMTGRVNRLFSQVPNDGSIYCYAGVTQQSHFIALSADATLTVERVMHVPGMSPCNADPATWAFSDAAIEFIR